MRVTPWLACGMLALAAPAANAEKPWYELSDEEAAARSASGHEVPHTDDIPHPLGERQRELRLQALQQRLAGKGSGRVHEVAKGQFVELSLERTDRVFVVLVEFGDQLHPIYGDPKRNPGGDQPGPRHNQIAEPDRRVDNTTIWRPDFSREHFERLYFNTEPGYDSVANYYRTQSSGRYTVEGVVTEWVRVPYNEARYGNNLCGRSTCNTVWNLVDDAIDVWAAQQLAAGKTPAEVKAYLDTFDTWDRYDFDHDGDFDEPDGYIDHFQIVHAGEGEETGGGAQGRNAIWSHRWYAFSNRTSPDGQGPSFNPRGGTRFGAVNKWVGDYTIQPENGGLGVFAHEYGHDLGLPDLYDTAGGDNPVGFWSIMASGSYLGDGTTDIGSRPGDFGSWEKLQLGWLNYDTASAGQRSSHRLGPAESLTKAAQGLVVSLPKKERTQAVFPPYAGSHAWHGGIGDRMDNAMVRTVSLPAASSIRLELRAWFDIEKDWDYAYVSVSEDGATFVHLPSTITTQTNPNGQNLGHGITGASSGWVPASFDLSAYAGKSIQLRLRYVTDAATVGRGLLLDELALIADGVTLFTDGAEASPNGWALSGFSQSDGVHRTYHDHYYLAEYRQYRGFDLGLETGPYNFGFAADGLPDYVEHYPYLEGLLIHYWDTSWSNNNTSVHPGEGRVLPIDSHPVPLLRGDNKVWRSRVQVYDAPFGLRPTTPISLKFNGTPRTEHPSLPAAPVFSDLDSYWFSSAPQAGVKVPATGTAIEVVSENTQGRFMQVLVRPAR